MKKATARQLRYIQGLNRQLGGKPVRFASQLNIYLPIRLRSVDLPNATRAQASEIIQRLLEAQHQTRPQEGTQMDSRRVPRRRSRRRFTSADISPPTKPSSSGQNQ